MTYEERRERDRHERNEAYGGAVYEALVDRQHVDSGRLGR